MNSPLSGVPIGSRRRLVVMLALFAVLFAAIGGVAVTGKNTEAAPVFSALAFIVAALLALLAWGVQRSVQIDVGEQQLDRAIEQTVATAMCGHEHDPAEVQVRGASPASCAQDGAGASCSHDCATCIGSRFTRESPV